MPTSHAKQIAKLRRDESRYRTDARRYYRDADTEEGKGNHRRAKVLRSNGLAAEQAANRAQEERENLEKS